MAHAKSRARIARKGVPQGAVLVSYADDCTFLASTINTLPSHLIKIMLHANTSQLPRDQAEAYVAAFKSNSMTISVSQMGF